MRAVAVVSVWPLATATRQPSRAMLVSRYDTVPARANSRILQIITRNNGTTSASSRDAAPRLRPLNPFADLVIAKPLKWPQGLPATSLILAAPNSDRRRSLSTPRCPSDEINRGADQG